MLILLLLWTWEALGSVEPTVRGTLRKTAIRPDRSRTSENQSYRRRCCPTTPYALLFREDDTGIASALHHIERHILLMPVQSEGEA